MRRRQRRVPRAGAARRPSSWASRRCSPRLDPGARTPGCRPPALTQHTERLKFLVAFRPGLHLAAAGRADGRDLPADLRRAAAAERRHRRRRRRATALRRPPRPRPAVRAHGRVPSVCCGAVERQAVRLPRRALPGRGRGCVAPPDPLPQVYFGGSSPPRRPVAARHADVYLTWGEPPEQVAREDRPVRAARRARGRDAPLRHPAAHHLAGHVRGGVGGARTGCWTASTRQVARAQAGARRQRVRGPAADAGAARRPHDELEIPRTCGRASASCAAARAPRSSAATQRSPTGSRSTTRSVSSEFILSGYPHLEEAYRFGEGVLPARARRGLLEDEARLAVAS